MDQAGLALLFFRDLTAEFHMVSYILLAHHIADVGIWMVALQWLTSFFHLGMLRKETSVRQHLECGMSHFHNMGHIVTNIPENPNVALHTQIYKKIPIRCFWSMYLDWIYIPSHLQAIVLSLSRSLQHASHSSYQGTLWFTPKCLCSWAALESHSKFEPNKESFKSSSSEDKMNMVKFESRSLN